YRSAEAVDWYTRGCQLAGCAMPRVTLRSLEWARAYNPGDYIGRVSPTPLLLQVAGCDEVTPTDLALQAYRDALEPKALQLLAGAGHFDVYEGHFAATSEAALQWFRQHMGDPRAA
ncbi:alpha/beta hydrolase, partial [Janthinobacterium sp.]|uniref:alpha/beta hydrolase n=1 Tax=Janthinobacterium sp. TaxID=1871054 RepID=UPI00293D773F